MTRVIGTELGNPVLLPSGRRRVIDAVRSAGLGGWKKRMPLCNEVDRGLNVPLLETVPTSNWSLIV